MKPRCKLGKHVDRIMKGGKRLECTICGDHFPCAGECHDHLDCDWARKDWNAVLKELGLVDAD